ncbi:MAG: hypothetical protein Q9214_007987, partial [Letrouitia sp. 1 TL-2023]
MSSQSYDSSKGSQGASMKLVVPKAQLLQSYHRPSTLVISDGSSQCICHYLEPIMRQRFAGHVELYCRVSKSSFGAAGWRDAFDL